MHFYEFLCAVFYILVMEYRAWKYVAKILKEHACKQQWFFLDTIKTISFWKSTLESTQSSINRLYFLWSRWIAWPYLYICIVLTKWVCHFYLIYNLSKRKLYHSCFVHWYKASDLIVWFSINEKAISLIQQVRIQFHYIFRLDSKPQRHKVMEH